MTVIKFDKNKRKCSQCKLHPVLASAKLVSKKDLCAECFRYWLKENE